MNSIRITAIGVLFFFLCGLLPGTAAAQSLSVTGLFNQVNPNNSSDMQQPFIWGDQLIWRENNKLLLLNRKNNRQTQLNDGNYLLKNHNLLQDMVLWEQEEQGRSRIYVYDLVNKVKRPVELPNPYGTRVSPEGLLWWVAINQKGVREIVYHNLRTGREERQELPLSIPSVNSFSAGERFVAWSSPSPQRGHELYVYDRLNKIYREYGSPLADDIYPVIDSTFLIYIRDEPGRTTIQAVDLEADQEWTIGPIAKQAVQELQASQGNVAWIGSVNGKDEIFNHNLATRATVQVTHDGHVKHSLFFDEGNLIWLEKGNTGGKEREGLKGISLAGPKHDFYDIVGHWAEGNIRELAALGLISGLLDQHGNLIFAPNKSITRAEFVALLERVLGDKPYDPLPPVGYRDIRGHWAEETIRKGAERGIVRGYQDRTFRPNAPISRAEIAAVLSRVINDSQKTREVAGFNDLSAEHWAYESIMTAARLGVMNGYAGGVFKPAGHATRAEVAAILHRVIGMGLLN